MTLREFAKTEVLKNLSVILSIVGTLYGVIHFGVEKVSTYDGYGDRIGRLEAHQVEIAELVSQDKLQSLQLSSTAQDLATLKTKVEAATTQMVDIRIDIERLRAMVGGPSR